MALMGIDAVVFGVADMKEAARFLDDCGVSRVYAGPARSQSIKAAAAVRNRERQAAPSSHHAA